MLMTDLKFPCIAFVKNQSMGHYIVIYKIKNDKLIVSDPMLDKIIHMTLNDFNEIFSGILILVDKNEVKTQLTNKILIDILKISYKSLIIVFIISLIFVALTLANSFYFKMVIDLIIPDHLDYHLTTFSLFFLGINLTRVFFDYIRTHLIIKLSNKIDIKISKRYFEKLVSLPLNFFENRTSGEIVSRFNDAIYIRNVISNMVVSSIINVVIIFSLSFILFKTNNIMFLTVLVPLLLLIAVTIILYEALRNNNNNVLKSRADTNTFLYQFVSNMNTLYSLNKKMYFLNQFNSVFSKQVENTFKEVKLENLNSFIKQFIQSSFIIIILWVGAKQIMSDSMTLGDLFFINSLIAFIMSSIEGLIGIQPEIQKAIVASNRFLDIINYPVTNSEHINNQKLSKIDKLEVKNLSFSYNNKDYIFNNLNFTINKNQKILLTGQSGIGKSTLSKILVKLYDIENNKVFINNTDINKYSEKDIRKKMIYLNENPFIFKGTIHENICMGIDITLEEIIECTKIPRINNFIEKLQGKYNFNLQEHGSNISTGQRQRLALARALAHKPEILILDESLSNVDSKTYKEIINNLMTINITIIFITHHNEIQENKWDKIIDFEELIKGGN